MAVNRVFPQAPQRPAVNRIAKILVPQGFVKVPAMMYAGATSQQLAFQQSIYQWAFEQAQRAVARRRRETAYLWN